MAFSSPSLGLPTDNSLYQWPDFTFLTVCPIDFWNKEIRLHFRKHKKIKMSGILENIHGGAIFTTAVHYFNRWWKLHGAGQWLSVSDVFEEVGLDYSKTHSGGKPGRIGELKRTWEIILISCFLKAGITYNGRVILVLRSLYLLYLFIFNPLKRGNCMPWPH